MGGKAAVPCPWCLFKSIQGLVKSAHMSRMSRICKTSGLRAVDSLRQCPMEEGILHIELVNWPLSRMSQGEDSTNSSRLDHRAERFIVVNTGTLGKATEDPASLVSVQSPISVKFMFENPLAGDHICCVGSRDKIILRSQGFHQREEYFRLYSGFT